jgi:hypothetical protein
MNQDYEILPIEGKVLRRNVLDSSALDRSMYLTVPSGYARILTSYAECGTMALTKSKCGHQTSPGE